MRKLALKLLPPNIAMGKKRGFEIPLLRWMEHDLNDLLMDTVLSDNSYCMNNFDRDAVKNLLSGKGLDKKRWANIVWGLLCLEIWLKAQNLKN